MPPKTARKPHRSASRAKHRPKPRPTPSRALALRVGAPNAKPWLLSAEEVKVLKNAVCKGATDDQLKFCLATARRYELDPFQGQIWFVPRWDSKAERTDGKQGATVYVPVVGINGLLHLAARDHADFGSFSEPEYGPMIEVKYQRNGQGAVQKLKVPEWCRIEARKKGCAEPTVAKLWWEEVYPNIDFSPMVRQMPRHMLAKCCKANATRTAYPKTGGLYIAEETQGQEFKDVTPQGRLIVEAENPALERYKQREAEELSKLTPAQREILEKKKAELLADSLRYTYFPESETYQIDGPQEMKTANKDLLGPLWSATAQAIVATPSDLGRLISQFESRKVPFREIKRV